MFWNVFFEGAILKNTYFVREQLMFWKVWAVYLKFMVAGYFRCYFIFLWLLNSVAADLYCLSKFSPKVKIFAILTCINTNLRCIKDCGLLWIKQTDGPGLCFEDQYEALQISRINCRLPGRPWEKQVVPNIRKGA